MGEKGNVAGVGEGVVEHVASFGTSAAGVAETVAVGVVTAVTADEAKRRRAEKATDEQTDDGGTGTDDKREI